MRHGAKTRLWQNQTGLRLWINKDRYNSEQTYKTHKGLWTAGKHTTNVKELATKDCEDRI